MKVAMHQKFFVSGKKMIIQKILIHLSSSSSKVKIKLHVIENKATIDKADCYKRSDKGPYFITMRIENINQLEAGKFLSPLRFKMGKNFFRIKCKNVSSIICKWYFKQSNYHGKWLQMLYSYVCKFGGNCKKHSNWLDRRGDYAKYRK